MDDTCVMCGGELPTESGSMVCSSCSNTNKHKTCPGCGSDIEVVSEEVYETLGGIRKSTLYHCYACGQDWEQETSYIEQCSVFNKKFWG